MFVLLLSRLSPSRVSFLLDSFITPDIIREGLPTYVVTQRAVIVISSIPAVNNSIGHSLSPAEKKGIPRFESSSHFIYPTLTRPHRLVSLIIETVCLLLDVVTSTLRLDPKLARNH